MIGEDMQTESNKAPEEAASSGVMDKTSRSNASDASGSDDDEDDIVVRKPANRRKSQIRMLEDSDESDAENNALAENPTLPQDSTSDDESSDKENNPKGARSQLTRRAIPIDDDDEDTDNFTVEEDVPPNSTAVRTLFNSDLFDPEMDDSDDGSDDDQKNNNSDSDIDDNQPLVARMPASGQDVVADDDSDEEPPELSAALLKKLKKGAAKKPKKSSSSSTPRVKKEDLQEIHSETQRLVRESSVRLPYHQPKPLGLSVFLARTQQKQQQLNLVLKNTPGCTWKTAPGLAVQPKLTPSSHKVASIPKTEPPATIPNSNLMERVKAKLNTSLPQPDFDNSNLEDKESTLSNLDGDELPDLRKETLDIAKSKSDNVPAESNDLIDHKTDCTEALVVDIHATGTKTTTEHDETKDLQKPEHDSGFLSAPLSSEEENSSEKKTAENESNTEFIHMEEETIVTDEDKIVSGDQEGVNNDNDKDGPRKGGVNQTPPSKDPGQKSFLTPKLANLNLDKVTPSLIKGADDFIDLDDEEETETKQTPSNPGVVKLMDRLMKHSAKRHKKKARDVKMNVLHKEKVGEGREELTMEKVIVHLDSEEDEDEEMKKAEAPGAKLTLLKQKLHAKMKQKREESRSKRSEQQALDNEDGFLDDGDEEAELTDQSDSDRDVEEDEEEAMEEEEYEEEDEDGYTVSERRKKKDNPYVDDEAEDDDDDGDEDHMRLELEASDGESSTQPVARTTSPKQYLKTTLCKTKTLDLFDDEALSESPVSSQENKQDNEAVSSRPFKSLSQSKSKGDNEDQNNTGSDLASANNSLLTEENNGSLVNEMDKESMNSADSSFDFMGTMIQAGQRKHTCMGTPELYTPSSKSSVNTCSTLGILKNNSMMSDIALPIEDTQDLLQGVCTPSMLGSSQKPDSQDLNFHLEDSQMLDDDGLLKVKSDKPAARRQLRLDLNSQSLGGMDELLGLCSGKFSGATSSPVQEKMLPLFEGGSQKSEDMNELLGLCSGQFTSNKQDAVKQLDMGAGSMDSDMDELLGLCSGRFTGKQPLSQSEDSQTTDTLICSQPAAAKLNLLNSPLIKKSKKRKKLVISDEDEEDFEVVPADPNKDDAETQSTASFDVGSDAEGEPDNEADCDNEEVEESEKPFRGFKAKGMLRKEFVDDEAELSGSEAESDEDLDIAEEDDILEEELGDLEDLPSDDELRNQVNRVHLKSLIDSDKRELRLLQEMYLEDGDLHSDGSGRMRRFRWKNVDDDTQQDMFSKSDDEEGPEEEDGEAESKWRMERHEREKFLQEHQAERNGDPTASSKVLKLGKVIFKQKSQGNTPVGQHTVSKTQSAVTPQPDVTTPTSEPKKNLNIFKVPSHHGSFLSRSKATLDKISEMTKPIGGSVSGPKNSRGFVFAQLSEEEMQNKSKSKQKKPVPTKSTSLPASMPPAKKPRLDKQASLPNGSIFNLL